MERQRTKKSNAYTKKKTLTKNNNAQSNSLKDTDIPKEVKLESFDILLGK